MSKPILHDPVDRWAYAAAKNDGAGYTACGPKDRRYKAFVGIVTDVRRRVTCKRCLKKRKQK